MSVISNVADATVPDVDAPTVTGRWQPMRAGAVNSWLWNDEVFHFCDGWLALSGHNGTGKSLTTSSLLTVLLDGDTSQKVLAVSGEAAGSLAKRHTAANDREDKTGTWWLEYACRDTDSGDVEWLTCGLWLRVVSGATQRAWFIVPGRVGQHLVLHTDRQPTSIEDLAVQVAACDGQLFTSSRPLRGKASAHLNVVAEESAYAEAVRERLFAPLDAAQYQALMTVLRSLRSVRTAESISPTQMRAVLTEALPALDEAHLGAIAEAMERIDHLEQQLALTREEADQLRGTAEQYERYLRATAALEAARLAAAQTAYDNQTRWEREARDQRDTAEGKRVAAVEAQTEAGEDIARLRGKIDAVDVALRDHAGAELPHLEEQARQLAGQHADATRRTERRRDSAGKDRSRAQEAHRKAVDARNHLRSLTDELAARTSDVGADSFIGRLTDLTARLCAPAADTRDAPDAPDAPDIDVDALVATPTAWAQQRGDGARRHRRVRLDGEQVSERRPGRRGARPGDDVPGDDPTVGGHERVEESAGEQRPFEPVGVGRGGPRGEVDQRPERCGVRDAVAVGAPLR